MSANFNDSMAWHQKHWKIFLYATLLVPYLIGVISDGGIQYSYSQIAFDFVYLSNLHAHVKFSLFVYLLIVGLVTTVLLNVYFKDNTWEDLEGKYAELGLALKIGVLVLIVIYEAMVVFLHGMKISLYFGSTSIILGSLPLLFSYVYLKYRDSTRDALDDSISLIKLTSIFFIIFIIIKPHSIESAYEEMRDSLKNIDDSKMQKLFHEAIKRTSYDSIIVSEREIMLSVQPYNYKLTNSKINPVGSICQPHALYLYSKFTNSDYYDVVKLLSATNARIGSNMDKDAKECFDELNNNWFQQRSLAIKTVFINSCNQRLIAC